MDHEAALHFTSLLDRAALAHLQSKALLPSFSHYDVWLHEHAVGFAVAKMMDEDLLKTTQNALVQAMNEGQSYQTFAKHLKPYLMAQGWWGEQVMTDPVDGIQKTVQLGSTRRLRVIYQTNMATAYAAGQWACIQEDKADFPYLKYIASVAERKRQSHMTYYGKIWRVDNPIWNVIFPPNGYGCQCNVRQLTEQQALRERAQDIEAHPERFNEEQRNNHRQGLIDDGTEEIEWVDFTNPRTGKTVKIPFDITPSFAHNHGDRLAALQQLAQEKHGQAFWQKLEPKMNEYLIEKINWSHTQFLDFSDISPDPNEIKRLAHDVAGSGNQALMEAAIGAKWQQYFNVKLERPSNSIIKGKKTQKSVDFLIVQPDELDKTKWQKLDIMYTLEAHANIEAMVRTIHKSWQAWEKHKQNIMKHLKKADIVPIYLPMLDFRTRSRIIAFVLSLPTELKNKIYFIWDKLL